MTPAHLDVAVVTNRLRLLQETLDQLAEVRGITAERLRSEALVRAGVERLLQVVVDLAVDVNVHVVTALLGRAPITGRESFFAAEEAGVLEADLAQRLAPSAGLRNVLVHRYTDIRVDLVAAAVGEVLDVYPAYVEQVATFVRDHEREQR